MTRTLLFLAVTTLAGCSDGAPDDILLLQGEADPGQTLILERRLSQSCYHSLHSGEPVEPFEELGRTEADASGGYTFELYRAQTSPGGDDRACFRVRSEGLPRSELRTQFFASDVRLPRLEEWTALPKNAPAGWTVGDVPVLPEGSLETYHAVEWQLDAEAGALWRADAHAPLVLPGDVREDFGAATLRAIARGQFLDYDDSLGVYFATYTEGSVTLSTPAILLEAPAQPVLPLSRGADCFADDVRLAPCPLTDGVLARAPLEEERFFADVVELRWPEVRPLRVLLLRGLEEAASGARIEVSSGGEVWTLAAELSFPLPEPEEWGALALSTPGRWLSVPLEGVSGDRLRLVAHDGSILTARELSVFE